ncbi:hypothetical protein E3P96_03389 [Wallemia ichthyophaga]|nr:hypothetical protein E3P96_03389 [Wallemia ichthyophaga]
MSADWFNTPTKSYTKSHQSPSPVQAVPADPFPLAQPAQPAQPPPRQGRTEAEQAILREERKKNKKSRKAEHQVFKKLVQDGVSTANTQSTSNSRASTAAQGRSRQKESQIRENEKLKNLEAGLSLSSSSESIEYTPFTQILNEKVHGIHRNIIGVIAGVKKRGRSKSGDSYLNMIVCDPSTPDSSKALNLNLFAVSEDELPKAQPSCVILVRHSFLQRFSFKIQAAGRKGDYNWALFNPETRGITTSAHLLPQLGKEEATYIDRISKWWKIINPDVLFVDDVPPPGALELCVTDYTQNPKLKEAWHGLHGNRVMKLSLYDEQRNAGKIVSSGNFILCNNVRPKMNPGILEGNMGSDFGKVNIHRLHESDERLLPLLHRKQEFDHQYGLPEYMATQSTHLPSSSIPESTPAMMSSSLETPSRKGEQKEQEAESMASPISRQVKKLPKSRVKTKLNVNHDTAAVSIDSINSISKSAHKYHIKARIVDFSPQIADWAKAKCTNCDVVLDTNDLVCGKCDQDAYVTYKYLFALLLEDERGDTLPAFCCDEDAVALFDGLSAEEARTEKGLLKMKKKLGKVLGHLIDAKDPEDAEQVTSPDEYNDFLIFSYKPVLLKDKIAYRVFFDFNIRVHQIEVKSLWSSLHAVYTMEAQSKPISGRAIAIAHTSFSSAAFISALIVGCYFHYQKLCRNSVARYPVEWFPSVSTTIGDFHPERSVFQLLIATCACPRFITIFLNWKECEKSSKAIADTHAILGLIRTFSCGGWSFITSTDNSTAHDIFMLIYILSNIIYMPLGFSLTRKKSLRIVRGLTSFYFIASLFPMFYTYFQHKTNKIPGAYTTYAFYEWGLIAADVIFDSVFISDLANVYIHMCNSSEPSSLNLQDDSIHVWSLSFAGQEGLMLVTLSSSLVTLKGVRVFASSSNGKTVLTMFSLLGVFASKLEFPVLKLAAVTMAVIAQTIQISSEWYTSNDENCITYLVLGLLLHSVSKLIANSNNPFWPIMNNSNGGHIYLGLILGFTALIVRRYIVTSVVELNNTKYKNDHNCYLVGAGLGSYIWALHTYLSDPSTLLSWSWTGFPIQGPHPIYHSTVIVVGFVIGMLSPKLLATSRVWHFFGTWCLGLCYYYDGWVSAGGAFGCAIFYPSLATTVFSSIRAYTPGRTLGAVFGTYTVLVVAHTFTVAYEFVPLGFLLQNMTTIKPYHADQQLITSGIWTVHFGMDDAMQDSQVRMRDLIREAEVDVVGLLETELQSIVFGNRNMAQYIAEDLGYYVDYGPPSHKHTWGAVLLSKFPILASEHHLLPSPQGELAPAIFAELNVYGKTVHTMVSHNGQEESPLDRELQTTEIARIISKTYPDPVLFLGYLVTKPHEERPAPYRILFEDGQLLDVEPLDRRRWCEYIGYRSMRKVAYARISHSSVTDTELQVAKFKLYEPDEVYHPQYDWYNFLDENDVAVEHRFSKAFEGKGMKGHKHALSIPIYYQEAASFE